VPVGESAQETAQFVVTVPAGLEGEARRELRQALPGCQFQPLFLKGNLLVSTEAPEEEALGRIAAADTSVVASVAPVQRRAPISAGSDSFAGVAGILAEIDRIRPGETFVVRCRRRGRHDWHTRDLERSVAAMLAEETGGVGEYETETDWHVTVQVFQDIAYVGVNRPDRMLRKELQKQRKYAPGERPLNRAQWKLKEALQAFGIELPADGRALDLGSAPGGWAAVLAGLVKEVVAVDPAELDPGVAALPNIRHLKNRAEALLEELEQWGCFDVLTSDMNRDPAEVAGILCQLARLLRPSAPAIMTVKYTTPSRRRHEREAKGLLSREFEAIQVRRLPHNARETTMAMRRKGSSDRLPEEGAK